MLPKLSQTWVKKPSQGKGVAEGWGDSQEGPHKACSMQPSSTETWHQTARVGGRERQRREEGGGRRRSLGSSCSPCQPGLLASLARGGGVLSTRQASGAERTGQGWSLRPVGREGVRRGTHAWVSLSSTQPGYPAICRQTSPGKSPFLLRLMAQPR